MHWMIVHYDVQKQINSFLLTTYWASPPAAQDSDSSINYIVLKYFIHGFQVYHLYFSRTNSDQFSQYSPIRGIAVLSAGMI
jgi:hypothetical protein